jgi:hypothetical protein
MDKMGLIVVVDVVVMVVNAFGVVASSSRDCHNTGRELLTGVQRASQLSRVGELYRTCHRHHWPLPLLSTVLGSLDS